MQVVSSTGQVSIPTQSMASLKQNLWRGVYSVIAGAGPAHALHFTTYEYCKELFDKKFVAVEAERDHWTHLLATAAAGACGTFMHDAFMTPFDGKWKILISPWRSLTER